MNNRLIYTIGGESLNDMDIVVSSAAGLFDLPAPRSRTTQKWSDMSGEMTDTLNRPTFDTREIELSCSMVCTDFTDFLAKSRRLRSLFATNGLLPLTVEYGNTSLYYLVYLSKEIEYERKWLAGGIVASFGIKLIEPEPFKRVYMAHGVKQPVTLTVKTETPVNIYWGDGSVSYDTGSGDIRHVYTDEADKHLVIITGDIEQLTTTMTYSELIWDFQ